MRIFRSVAFKLSLMSSLFVLAVIGTMARRVFLQIEQSFVSEMTLRGEFFARSTREALFPKQDPFALHFAVMEMLKEKAVVYACVLGPEGRILSHSDPARVGERDAGGLAARALASEGPLVQKFIDPRTGRETFDLAVPVRMLSRRVGTARIGFSRDSVKAALAGPRRQIALIAVVSIALAVLGTILIVNWLIRPLPVLAEAARRMGRGDFDVSVECRSRDEIGVLARAFNEMRVANALLFKSLREEKDKLETVFNQTHEGLAWVDAGGRFLLLNKVAGDLLGAAGRGGQTLARALEGFETRPPLHELLSSERKYTPCEFIRREPKLLVLEGVVERIGEEGQPASLLLIFRDVTIERREEELERNFLSLVSHKLRTPLMVVMSYVELLLGDPEKLQPFHLDALRKVRKQADLLHILVEKLLAYAVVQSPQALAVKRERASFIGALEAALKALSETLGAGGVEMLLDRAALGGLPALHADAHLLEEALKNLLENAVKFNRAPRKEVRVSAGVEGGFVRVVVADNGPGIPPEEQPRLFRKFYQIDDDFTGQVVGMGLGLAFVKNVVEAHGGRVGLSSMPGKGSEFFFTIPLFSEG